MSNARAKAKQIDITRAIKGALAAGMEISEAEIRPDGSIRVFAKSATTDSVPNEIDKMLSAE